MIGGAILPWPPSTNNAYSTVRGRRVKTKAAREYALAVQGELLRDRQMVDFRRALPTDPRFRVTIVAHPPDRRRRDLANLEKLAIDATFAWLGLDDSRIDELHLIRRNVAKIPNLMLTLEVLP